MISIKFYELHRLMNGRGMYSIYENKIILGTIKIYFRDSSRT